MIKDFSMAMPHRDGGVALVNNAVDAYRIGKTTRKEP